MDGLPLVKGRDVIGTRLIGSPISLFMLPVISHITMQGKSKDAQLVGVSPTCTFQWTNKAQKRERWKGQSSAKVVSSLLSWTRSLRATLIKCRMDRGVAGVQMDDP